MCEEEWWEEKWTERGKPFRFHSEFRLCRKGHWVEDSEYGPRSKCPHCGCEEVKLIIIDNYSEYKGDDTDLLPPETGQTDTCSCEVCQSYAQCPRQIPIHDVTKLFEK